jgi:L-lactate dehydrogenase complex protein LldG
LFLKQVFNNLKVDLFTQLEQQQAEKKPQSMLNDVEFAENFVTQGGKFIYCESTEQFFVYLKSLQTENKWNYIFSWNQNLVKLMTKYEFQENDPEMLIQFTDAALSFCESLIAENGTILLSPDQSSHRKLTTFPKFHIIVACKKNLEKTLEEALKKFNESYINRLPSILELNEEKKHYKANHTRLLSATGTNEVFVFYIDSEEIE